MDIHALQALFSTPPASFVWATKEGRAIGASDGFLMDLWPDRIEAAALFTPNRAQLAQRNATLFLLLLMAMRPQWQNAHGWFAEALGLAKNYRPTETHPYFDLTNTEHRVRFTWDARASRATLRVEQ